MPNEEKPTAKDLTKLLDENLGEITAGGNLNLKLSFVSSFAQALNEKDTEEESDEDIEANKKVITFFLMFCYLRYSTGGGALGYFLGGYVPPGTPNWHPVLEKISPKIDTPF